MSTAGMFLLFVAVLVAAARLLLRGERKPPLPSHDRRLDGSAPARARR